MTKRMSAEGTVEQNWTEYS